MSKESLLNAQQFYDDVWMKGKPPRDAYHGEWPIRFAEAYADFLLREYGAHKDGCLSRPDCTCGWEQIRKRVMRQPMDQRSV